MKKRKSFVWALALLPVIALASCQTSQTSSTTGSDTTGIVQTAYGNVTLNGDDGVSLTLEHSDSPYAVITIAVKTDYVLTGISAADATGLAMPLSGTGATRVLVLNGNDVVVTAQSDIFASYTAASWEVLQTLADSQKKLSYTVAFEAEYNSYGYSVDAGFGDGFALKTYTMPSGQKADMNLYRDPSNNALAEKYLSVTNEVSYIDLSDSNGNPVSWSGSTGALYAQNPLTWAFTPSTASPLSSRFNVTVDDSGNKNFTLKSAATIGAGQNAIMNSVYSLLYADGVLSSSIDSVYYPTISLKVSKSDKTLSNLSIVIPTIMPEFSNGTVDITLSFTTIGDGSDITVPEITPFANGSDWADDPKVAAILAKIDAGNFTVTATGTKVGADGLPDGLTTSDTPYEGAIYYDLPQGLVVNTVAIPTGFSSSIANNILVASGSSELTLYGYNAATSTLSTFSYPSSKENFLPYLGAISPELFTGADGKYEFAIGAGASQYSADFIDELFYVLFGPMDWLWLGTAGSLSYYFEYYEGSLSLSLDFTADSLTIELGTSIDSGSGALTSALTFVFSDFGTTDTAAIADPAVQAAIAAATAA